jgi:hypothetical protein
VAESAVVTVVTTAAKVEKVLVRLASPHEQLGASEVLTALEVAE